MGTGAPTPVVIPVHAAPKKAPCPECGKHGLPVANGQKTTLRPDPLADPGVSAIAFPSDYEPPDAPEQPGLRVLCIATSAPVIRRFPTPSHNP
jgi:hypothetical protein